MFTFEAVYRNSFFDVCLSRTSVLVSAMSKKMFPPDNDENRLCYCRSLVASSVVGSSPAGENSVS